ncbi:P-loop containing nucleoside triphosphate hydrolase protein [Pseudovirgaria hyperparasitica]|uniref:RNA helicase n=1 Tax=Pseudovirgaria hyperparasitica TaxID=470096 RepID=A0A6A6WFU7_9PEZI|nr:P-loop containing nucleoside triphosphate hydrolase protein [Pseudovirgaria hyperparasitica]KAF2760900.1 P-loop containing nucleoside triphosphate hydrolase protein [Pseudovirgaria hyperparasitica]
MSPPILKVPSNASGTNPSHVSMPTTSKKRLLNGHLKASSPDYEVQQKHHNDALKPLQNNSDDNGAPGLSSRRPVLHEGLAQKLSAGKNEQGRHKGVVNEQKKAALLKLRKELPIWNHERLIRQSLSGNKDIMLMVGETGSGKSTQVPQFLMTEPWCKRCIAITQPRRVAAISLARRVADEMGMTLGAPACQVGYSVRFDTSIGPNTRIKFLTEGMLLQEMLRDPTLPQYSAVIVDEVHERSVNVDLILGFLRNLVSSKRAAMKVVVMSATADVEGLTKFFQDGLREKTISNGTDRKATKVHSQGTSSSSTGSAKAHHTKDYTVDAFSDRISTCLIKGRQFDVKTTYVHEPTQDFVEEALKTIFRIHCKEPLPGDILVFLTGQETVESLQRLVNEYAGGLDEKTPKILTLPLFAALPQIAQQRVFDKAPHFTRKVILATNIAETSITVPGIRYVIDCGKVKMKHFRNNLGLESLLVKPISMSSAIQRQGRAGREAPGQCFRLYTERSFQELQKVTTPEILRCDLSQALLTIMARGVPVQDIITFPFLDRPSDESLKQALTQLLQLGALNESAHFSHTGKQLARLPLSPTLGRVILEAAKPERDCLSEIIDIIACLSVENIFLNIHTEEKKEAAEEARRSLFRREGDHLTLLATIRAYSEEQSDRRAWSDRHFVSHRAMQNVIDIRKQLRAQCVQMKLLDRNATEGSRMDEDTKAAMLQCLLRGFATNTARLMPDGSYKTMVGNQVVAIHPTSVLFGRKVEAIVFSEFVFTNRSYARGVSAVQLSWVGDVLAGAT